MDGSTSTAIDDKSAVSQFLGVLIDQRDVLEQALKADSEAMRMLSAIPSWNVADDQAQREYAESMGGCKAPRRWDERDEKRWAWLFTAINGACPADSRVVELFQEWGQRNGFAALDRLFQSAVFEEGNPGASLLLAPRLQEAYDAHCNLISVARRLSEDSPLSNTSHPDWGAALERHHNAICSLPKLMPPAWHDRNQVKVPAQRPAYLGQGRYVVGDETICLPPSQAELLGLLVELKAATLSDLKKNTSCSNPSATLKKIRENYPKLAPYIEMPGDKGKGGYKTTIIDGRSR